MRAHHGEVVDRFDAAGCEIVQGTVNPAPEILNRVHYSLIKRDGREARSEPSGPIQTSDLGALKDSLKQRRGTILVSPKAYPDCWKGFIKAVDEAVKDEVIGPFARVNVGGVANWCAANGINPAEFGDETGKDMAEWYQDSGVSAKKGTLVLVFAPANVDSCVVEINCSF